MKWIVTEIAGKIASVSANYEHFSRIAAQIAALPVEAVATVSTRKISTPELQALVGKVCWL